MMKYIIYIVLFSFLVIHFSNAIAQTGENVLRGIVKDSVTMMPIPYANISVGEDVVNITNTKGEFTLKITPEVHSISILCVGYETRIINLSSQREIQILMKVQTPLMSEQEMQSMDVMKENRTTATLLRIINDRYIPIPTSISFENRNPVELGPFNSLFSSNAVEGFRIRAGGQTTPHFNPHWQVGGYGAYGFDDKTFKYKAEVTYAFNERTMYFGEFPVNNITASYEYDLQVPGQALLYTNRDNTILSFTRQKTDKMSYVKQAVLRYNWESTGNLSLQFYGRWKNDVPAGTLYYAKLENNGISNIPELTSAELGVSVRYAPNEKVYQTGGTGRISITQDAPAISLAYKWGIPDFLGSDYSYHHIEANFRKRFGFSALGNLDLSVSAGRIWGTLPFPLLILPNVNSSYAWQPEMYSMMNVLEFINDKFVAVDASYHLNGWLFNRIPLIKKLKWREIITFKAMWGGLDKQNNPDYNNDIFFFPTDEQGKPLSFVMTNTPYMELGFGIGNIFKLFRVDLIQRLTYLDNPNVDRIGIRANVEISF